MNGARRLLDKCSDTSYRSMSLIPQPVHSSGQRVMREEKRKDGKRKGRKRGRENGRIVRGVLGTCNTTRKKGHSPVDHPWSPGVSFSHFKRITCSKYF